MIEFKLFSSYLTAKKSTDNDLTEKMDQDF